MCGGGKGNKTETQQSQTYTPNPYVAQAGQQAIIGAEAAAAQPFQMPVAPVAGFTPFQEQAFGATQGALGMAQPFINQGAGYFNQSAAPITAQDVNQYYNPMAQNVTNQLQNIFGQQMRQTTGQATQAAGGVGADRIGVAQANLANQQGLAAGQTYAGLYNQALQAAQQQKQMAAGAGYGLGSLGPAAQSAQLQSIGALGQAGGLQQQLAQAQMNAPYQNILAKIAYPFQTSQYLAGIAGGLGPALGGTTSGMGVTTYPTPSPLNQALGIGTSLAGMYGSTGGFGGLFGGGGQSSYGATYGAPSGGYGSYGGIQYPTFAQGGEVDDQQDQPPPFPGVSIPKTGGLSPIPYVRLQGGSGQFHNNLNLSAPQQKSNSSSGLGDIAKIATSVLPFFLARGGALGGSVDPTDAGRGFATDDDYIDDPFTNTAVPDILAPTLEPSVGGAPIDAPDVPLPRGRPDTVGGVRSTIANEWSRSGMNPVGIAGINMNVSDESRFNPSLRHPDQPRFSGEAHYAHGLYQEGGDEWNNYQNWLQKNAPGSDWRDPALQSRFTAENLRENYPQVFRGMQNAHTPGEAASIFARGYLKPAAGPLASRVNKYLGTEGEGELPPGATPVEYRSPLAGSNADMQASQYMLPAADRPYPDALQRDWGQNVARSPWMSLIEGGAKMAQTVGPVGSAIGAGIQAGAKTLEGQRKELRSEQDINLKAQDLYQKAVQHLDEYKRMKPYQAGELAKPVVVGQTIDALGRVRVIYGQRQPDGSFVDPVTHQKIDQSAISGISGPVGNVGEPAGPGVTEEEAAKGVHAIGTHPEVLDELKKQDPGIAATVKAISEGRQNLQSAAYKDKTLLARYVNLYDPNWNQQVFSQRQKQLSDMTSNGNAGKMLLAVNQLWPHLETASKKAEELNNTNYPAENTIANWFATQTGDPRIKRFESVREVAALDAARLLRGSGQMAEKDIEQWRTLLSSAGSPRQLQGVIAQLADELMTARVGSIEQAYRVNMGKEPPKNLISDEARTALNTIKARAAATEARETTGAEQPAQPQTGGFTGRTATGPNGKKLRETSDGRWIP